jgi:hypothetical protein
VEEAKEGEKWRGEVRGSDGGDAKGGFGGFFFARGMGVGIYLGVPRWEERRRVPFFFLE